MKNRQIRTGFSWTKAAPYIFVAPAVIYIICLTMIPAIMALPISFTNWSALSPNKKFVGLDNYVKLFGDKDFWRSCLVMAKFFIYIPIVMATGLGAALLVNSKSRGTQIFRVVFYAPVITSTVAVAILFDWFYQPTFGLFNAILKWFGLPAIGWLTDPKWALYSVIIVTIWKGIGYYMMIYLAALMSVPKELYEACEIDGAGFLRKHLTVTVPHIMPTIALVTTISAISAMKVFAEIYVMTKGGPLNSSKTIVYYIYERAFENLDLGFASAMAVVLLLIVLALSFVNVIFFERNKYQI